MELHTISWLDEFSCLGSDCTDNCCHSWVVPLDSDDINRFSKERGLLGLRLYCASKGLKDKINTNAGKCTFLSKKGLCSLQQKKGADFIPWACRNYPRFYRNYGEFEEISLDLTCVGAARLFLAHTDDTSMTFSDGEPHTLPCTTNDDTEILYFLLRIREEIINVTRLNLDEKTLLKKASITDFLSEFTDIIISFGENLQTRLFKHNSDAAPDIYNSISFKEYFEERYKTKDKEESPAKIGTDNRYFPLSLSMLNKLLNTSLTQRGISEQNPTLSILTDRVYELIETLHNSDRKLYEYTDTVLRNNPRLLSVIREYFCYNCLQYFLRTYETYSFRKQLALGLVHTGMLLIFLLTLDEKEIKSDDILISIIGAYNRRALFNERVADELMSALD